MKMGTTASPWRYDGAAADAIRPDNRRRTAILRYASWATVFPISLWSGYPSIAALSTSRGIHVMGQFRTQRVAHVTGISYAADMCREIWWLVGR